MSNFAKIYLITPVESESDLSGWIVCNKKKINNKKKKRIHQNALQMAWSSPIADRQLPKTIYWSYNGFGSILSISMLQMLNLGSNIEDL